MIRGHIPFEQLHEFNFNLIFVQQKQKKPFSIDAAALSKDISMIIIRYLQAHSAIYISRILEYVKLTRVCTAN